MAGTELATAYVTLIPSLKGAEKAIEKELVNTFRTTYEGPITLDPEELEDGRFWRLDEIEANLGKNLFTPNFEQEYKRLFSKR